uniref:YveK family protein n=1 Tax=Agathobacter sp. TaxID=2021311 RepID=UPI00405643AD
MEKQYESDEIEIDLKELFFELLVEWKKIAVSTVLAGLIMFVISAFILTPQYESTSKLYVLSKSTSITSLTDLQMGTNLTNDYMEIVGGRPILDAVIDNVGLDMAYTELASIITFNNPSDSRILEITVTHPEPEVAKKIADEMADVAAAFIAEKMDQDPPSVIQYGYIEEDPVSPSIVKNTAIGILAGAFLAMAVVIITYLLNDTIMTPDDMERKVGIQVLASLPFDEEEDDGIPVNSSKKGVKKMKSGRKSSSQKESSGGEKKQMKKAANSKGGK